MMNWPTAFVIAVAICAGAFLYNKPSHAALGGSDRGVVALKGFWIQFDGNKQRLCTADYDAEGQTGISCWNWKTN